jgi:hypothetical protein
MEATDKEGTKEMSTAIPDPPEAGGVEASQPWIAGIVARKATGRASARRSARVGENCVRIRIRTNRQKKSAAVALCRKIRRSRRSLSLRDETRNELGEAERPEIG